MKKTIPDLSPQESDLLDQSFMKLIMILKEMAVDDRYIAQISREEVTSDEVICMLKESIYFKDQPQPLMTAIEVRYSRPNIKLIHAKTNI